MLVDEIAAACERLGMHVVVGVNERDGGSLYNAYLLIGPDGLLHRHRKLMPTQQERLFHGIGAGDDLAPVETPLGRIGGLICWENRMPLARWAVYQGTPQIWCAPTADDSDGWLATARHIAIESGAFVVSVPQYIPGSAFPEDFPVEIDRDDVLRPRRRRDRRAHLGRGHRRPAVRRRGDPVRRLRPARGAARQALVRRRRALRADGRPLARTPDCGFRGYLPTTWGMSRVPKHRGPFGPDEARRLLWRAGFGPRPGQAERLAERGLDRAVDSLVQPEDEAPDRPGAGRREGPPAGAARRLGPRPLLVARPHGAHRGAADRADDARLARLVRDQQGGRRRRP